MSKLVRGWKKDEFSTPNAIWEVKKPVLDVKSKLVYVYLVACLDTEGQAMPSYKEIGEACCMSERSAQYAVEHLEKVGLISKVARWKAPKVRDTNLYIIYHPVQAGLVQEESGANPASGVVQNLHQGGANPADNIVSPSVSPSVGSSDMTPEEQIANRWKKAFKENIGEFELEEILSYGVSIEKIKEIIRKVSLYIDIKTTPFSVVVKAVAAEAQGKPWEFNEDAGETKPQRKTRNNTRRVNQGEKLPEAVQRQLERQKQQGQHQEEQEHERDDKSETLEEKRARIRRKLAESRAKLSRRNATTSTSNATV